MLNLVLNIDKEEWKKIYHQYSKDLPPYDKDNKKFKNIIKDLNIPLANEN